MVLKNKRQQKACQVTQRKKRQAAKSMLKTENKEEGARNRKKQVPHSKMTTGSSAITTGSEAIGI